MEKKKDFVMSSESLNTYGFWTSTEGIDLTDFLKNPVGYYNHECNELPPIKWENVRKENGVLMGTAVFDEKDEFSMKLWEKVENGFISGASIGFRPLEFSEDPKQLKKGQRNATVTKCKLVECSIVNTPANSEALAVRLYSEEAKVLLSEGEIQNVVPKLRTNMFEKLTTLGYKDAEAVLGELQALKSANETLKTTLQALETKQKEANKAQITALCSQKGLDKTETDAFLKLADADFEATITVLTARQDYVPVSTQIANNAQGQSGSNILATLHTRQDWNYNTWATKDPAGLAKLKQEHPAKFEELYQKTFAK